MNKSIKSSFFLLITLSSFNSFGQAIDPDLLESLTPAQIELAKSELLNSYSEVEAAPRDISESTIRLEASDGVDISDKKFGYDYFSSAPTSISALGDLPLPNDYKISLNDQFAIILSDLCMVLENI